MDATVAILLAVMMCILGVEIGYYSAVIQSRLDDIEEQIMESKADFYSLHLLEKMVDSVDSHIRGDGKD